MRIAHISDLHFSKFTLNPLQFFSKRWLGNLNLLFFRRNTFDHARLGPLPALFKKQKVDLVIISGDLSTTSRRKEFKLAQEFVKKIEAQGIPVVTLPGNHDQYTKRAYKRKHFYKYFNSPLKEQGVLTRELGNRWQLIALDSAIATSLVSSQGLFSPELEKALAKQLSKLPQNAQILLVNHFPLFQSQGPRRALKRGEALSQLVRRDPRIKLYLQGHTHLHTIADLRPSGLPIILDSGSATHKKDGSWHLLQLGEKRCDVESFRWKEGAWSAEQKVGFEL